MGSIVEKIVCSQDVIFREVRGNSKSEEVQTKKELDKLVFELRNDEHDSNESIELDEDLEHSTLVVRGYEEVRKQVERYSPPNFHYVFVLSGIDEEPKSVREVVDST
jgi:hypothetical protein